MAETKISSQAKPYTPPRAQAEALRPPPPPPPPPEQPRAPSEAARNLMRDSFEPSRASAAPVNLSGAAPAGTPVAATAVPASAPAQEPIREERVEQALRMTVMGHDVTSFLNSEGLTQAEKDAYIAALVKDPDKQHLLYAEVERPGVSDNRQVAEAIDSAFRAGQLTSDDLLKLADLDGSGMGAQRLVNMLMLDPGQRLPGSAMEALAVELSQRNGSENDRIAAALAFTSSPQLTAAHLDTPQKRTEAFTTLTGALTGEYPAAMPEDLKEEYRSNLIGNVGRLFVSHGPEVVDALTEPGNRQGPEALSTFFSEVMFSDEVNDHSAGPRRTLLSAIQDTVGNIADGYLNGIQNTQDPVAREQAALKIGRLVGAIGGGAEMRIARYNEELQESAAKREALTGVLNTVLGKVGGAIAGAAGGGPVGEFAADQLTSQLADVIGRALVQDPERPDVDLGSEIFFAMQGQIANFERQTGIAGVSTSFEAGWSAWRHLIEDAIEKVS